MNLRNYVAESNEQVSPNKVRALYCHPAILFMLYKSVDLGFDRGMKMKYLLLILILIGYGAYLQIMSSAVDAQLANLKHMYSDIPAQIVSSN